MTHRAQQIIDAIATLVRTRVEPSGVHVYTHRRDSLSAEQDELPADSVDYGELEPLEDEADTEIYWALSCSVTAVVKAPTEPEAHEAAIAQAREIHRAIMANATAARPWRVTLGLAFAINVHPRGWDEPIPSNAGAGFVMTIKTNWRVIFKTNVDDPGDG